MCVCSSTRMNILSCGHLAIALLRFSARFGHMITGCLLMEYSFLFANLGILCIMFSFISKKMITFVGEIKELVDFKDYKYIFF